MTEWTRHCGYCGYCGVPLRDCACGMAALAAAQPPPVNSAPGYGGPLVPPGTPSPFAPQPPPQRFVKRGFYICCETCGMAVEWCACARQAAEIASADGAHSDLSKRIAELRGRD